MRIYTWSGIRDCCVRALSSSATLSRGQELASPILSSSFACYLGKIRWAITDVDAFNPISDAVLSVLFANSGVCWNSIWASCKFLAFCLLPVLGRQPAARSIRSNYTWCLSSRLGTRADSNALLAISCAFVWKLLTFSMRRGLNVFTFREKITLTLNPKAGVALAVFATECRSLQMRASVIRIYALYAISFASGEECITCFICNCSAWSVWAPLGSAVVVLPDTSIASLGGFCRLANRFRLVACTKANSNAASPLCGAIR